MTLVEKLLAPNLEPEFQSFTLHIAEAKLRVKNHFKDVEDVAELELHGFEEFQELFNSCFGAEGYMTVLPREEQEEAKRMIATAYVLAEYGHQHQLRKSGQRYIIHPLAITKDFCIRYKQNATVVCAGLLHDIIEDSEEWGHKVTMEDIRTLFGKEKGETEELVAIIDGLTKVRVEVKQQEFGQTVKKILEIGEKHPAVLGLKVYDRLHNMRTIEFLPYNKQRRIAWETLAVFAPLAYAGGYMDAYHELMDIATSVLSGEADPAIMIRTQELMQQPLTQEETKRIIDAILVADLSLQDHVVARPLFFHEVYSWVKSNFTNPEYDSLSLVPLDIELNDFVMVEDLIEQRDILITNLMQNKRRKFYVTPDRNLAVSYMHEQYQAGNTDLPTTFYTRLNQSILALTVWNESHRLLFHVPLSVLTEVGSENNPFCDHARQKIQIIGQKMNRTSDVGEDSDLGWLLGTTLEGSMTIEVEEGSTKRRIPLKSDSTVMDALLLGVGQLYEHIMINDRPIKSVKRILKSGDKLSVDGSLFVEPEWFKSIKNSTMCEPDFQEQLRMYWKGIEGTTDPRVTLLKKKISELGQYIFFRSIPGVKQFHPKRILNRLHNTSIDPDTFYIQCALGEINEDELPLLRQAYVEYWTSLKTIQLYTEDTEESVVKMMNRFRKVYKQTYSQEHRIKIKEVPPLDTVTMSFDWDPLVSTFVITLWYDANTDLSLLEKARDTVQTY